jgi:peptide/nickel transport system permease protein
MFKTLIKKPKFLLGFVFLVTMVITSFFYEPFIAEHIKKYDFFTYKGELVGPPFTPLELPPLGSDRLGTPLWTYIIQGAKFTILLAIVISFIQVIFGLLISVFFLHFLKRIQKILEVLVESMIYVPVAVIAFWLLLPLEQLINNPEEHFIKLLINQALLISIIGIPSTLVVLLKEIQKSLQEEYVLSSRVLGGRGWFLYRKHVLTILSPRLVLLFFQRNVQVLVLFAHLGFINIFLGGKFEEEIMIGESRMFSLSNEWAGNIGKAYVELMTAPWLILAPLVALSLAVLSFNFMASSIQEIMLKETSSFRKRNGKRMQKEMEKDSSEFSDNHFTLVRKKHHLNS